MIYSGLVSITFRELSTDKIIKIIEEAGLDSVEWGGDIHVPHGDTKKAQQVYQSCQNAGIKTPTYGSYYRAGERKRENISFQSVLDSACALNSDIIRIWAGKIRSSECNNDYRKAVVDDCLEIADMAATQNKRISFEFHDWTLTDSDDSALKLLKEVDKPNVTIFWQPPTGMSTKNCLSSIPKFLNKLENIHVFHWVLENSKRVIKSLSEGEDCWTQYLNLIKQNPQDRYAMLEFVKDGTIEQFLDDSKTLKKLLKNS